MIVQLPVVSDGSESLWRTGRPLWRLMERCPVEMKNRCLLLSTGARQDEQLIRIRNVQCVCIPVCIGDDGSKLERLPVCHHRTEKTTTDLQPSATDGVLLHPCGRHGLRRTRHCDAGRGIDDWNGVTTGASRRRLVQLQSRVVTLKRRRDECGRGGVEREGRRDSGRLLGGGRLGRQARQRGPLRRGNGESVAVCQQVWDEIQIILELERPGRFEFHAIIGKVVRRFRQLLHTPDTAKLLLGILRDRQPRRSPVPSAMVRMLDGGCGGRRRVLLVGVEVIIRGHC